MLFQFLVLKGFNDVYFFYNTLEVGKFKWPYLQKPSAYLTLICHVFLEVSKSFR